MYVCQVESLQRIKYRGPSHLKFVGVCVAFAAMQMWTLARFLPLVIGHLIPEDDEHWENFLCLLEIMDILFAHRVSLDLCGYLEVLISEHHSTFLNIYPHASITLKMHSLIHTPRLILQ